MVWFLWVWNCMQARQCGLAGSEFLEAEALAHSSHAPPFLSLLDHAFFSSCFLTTTEHDWGGGRLRKERWKFGFSILGMRQKKKKSNVGWQTSTSFVWRGSIDNLVAMRGAVSLVSLETKWRLRWLLLSTQNSFNSPLNILHIKQYVPCCLHGTWASCCL